MSETRQEKRILQSTHGSKENNRLEIAFDFAFLHVVQADMGSCYSNL
jgi:hypothetical protein